MKKNLILILLVVIAVLAGCGKAPQDDLAATEAFESALQTAVMQTVEAEREAAKTEDESGHCVNESVAVPVDCSCAKIQGRACLMLSLPWSVILNSISIAKVSSSSVVP